MELQKRAAFTARGRCFSSGLPAAPGPKPFFTTSPEGRMEMTQSVAWPSMRQAISMAPPPPVAILFTRAARSSSYRRPAAAGHLPSCMPLLAAKMAVLRDPACATVVAIFPERLFMVVPVTRARSSISQPQVAAILTPLLHCTMGTSHGRHQQLELRHHLVRRQVGSWQRVRVDLWPSPAGEACL